MSFRPWWRACAEPPPACSPTIAKGECNQSETQPVSMNAGFFDAPILPPYKAPSRHWDLNAKGRPTGTIGKSRRRAEFVAAVPGTVGET